MSDSSELKKRIATGVVGAAILLSLIFFGGRLGIAVVATVLSLGMIYEFASMTLSLPDLNEKRFVLLGLVWLVEFINFWVPRAEYEMVIFVFLGLFIYFLFSAGRHEGDDFKTHFQELMSSYFGVFYLGFLPLFLILIHDSVSGIRWTILFLLINWAGDVGAYFAGKRFGRTKLYPAISPKKTREGALGGLILSILVSFVFKLSVFRQMTWGAAFITPILVGVIAPIGDLCESFLKRAFGKKDSGSILPGHGGFLDRFDGVVFSLPIMYLCIRIFGS